MDAKNQHEKEKLGIYERFHGRTTLIVQGKLTTACMGWSVDGDGGQSFNVFL
jgi:hypothetical protein